MALSFYCLHKFGTELLNTFEYTANYHNSLLPHYKGIMATGWSVYHGEKETGFTFHRMNENFDEGAVLIQGRLPIRPHNNVTDLEFAKGIAASKCVSSLLEMMVNRERGQPQTGRGSYFSQKDLQKIRRIGDPSKYSSTELTKRLRAFGFLCIRVKGRWYMVVGLEKTSFPPGIGEWLIFRTRDGVTLRPARFQCIPLRAFKRIERLVGAS
jgi:methionyl-tRNA formyltransferase